MIKELVGFIGDVFTATISAATTLVAAFTGSWLAFYLTDRAHARRELEQRAAAGNRALLTLLQQFNALATLQKQVIDPKRDDALRFTNMRAIAEQPNDIEVDINSLAFVIETPHLPVLMDVMIASQSFRTAIDAVNRRSKLHERIQPLLEPAGIYEQMTGSRVELEALFKKAVGGEYLFLSLVRATDQAIDAVDRAADKTLNAGKSLRSALKAEFPKRKFLGFDPLHERQPKGDTK